MPQSVAIDLPVVIAGGDGLPLACPIGFPDISVASSTNEHAMRFVRRRVTKHCSKLVGTELVARIIRGPIEIRTVAVQIAAEKDSVDAKCGAWRTPLEIRFDTLVWHQAAGSQETAIVVAYVPPLDLTIVATPKTDLELLVQEQIRSAIRRRDLWSMPGLFRLGQTVGLQLHTERLDLQTPTPAEHERDQEDQPKSKTPTLQSVATRLKPSSLFHAFFRDDEVRQLDRLLSAKRPRSVLLVGPPGVGKTAVFHQWVRQRGSFGDDSMRAISCWATDGSRLISGQTGYGMWQEQALQMVSEARRYPAVIHFGNLVELCESGRLGSSGGCGSLLASPLSDGAFRAVIECTPGQLTKIQRSEPRLVQA